MIKSVAYRLRPLKCLNLLGSVVGNVKFTARPLSGTVNKAWSVVRTFQCLQFKPAFGVFFCLVNALALVAALALAPTSALAESHDTVEKELGLAMALVNRGRFIEALSIVRPHATHRLVRAESLFVIGLAAAGQAERMPEGEDRTALLNEAILVFHAILVHQPENVRVRLELARAFFLKGEDSLARQNFERVLAGKPPEPVVKNIERYLDAIKERRWSASFSFAIAPDSNINTASNEEIVYLFDLPFVLDSPQYEESGVGLYVSGQGEYQFPINDRTRLRLGASFRRTEYQGSGLDNMNVTLRLGPRYFVNPVTDVSALLEAGQNWSGSSVYNSTLGLRLEGNRRIGRQAFLSAGVGYREKTHVDESDRHYDGPETDFNLNLTYRVSPTLRYEVGGGVSYDRPKDAPERHSDSLSGSLGFTKQLKSGFTIGGTGTWIRTKYDGIVGYPTIDGSPRRDNRRIWRLSILNRELTLLGFSPQLGLIRENLDTNAQASSYERDRAELNFVRQF